MAFALPALPTILGGATVGGTAATAGIASSAMASSIAAGMSGSLLAAPVASAVTTGLATSGIAATAGTGIGFGSILSGLSTIGSVVSGVHGFMASQSQAAHLEAGQRLSTMSTQLEIQRSRTTKALEQAERERRLRAALATQRAQMAGKVEQGNLGTPATLQNQLIGSINRENRYSDLFTSTDIASLKINDANNRIGTSAEISASKMAGFSGLLDTGMGLVDTLNKKKELV